MPYKKIKIAVLMYGQVRTGVYCAPWIKEWFKVPARTPVVLHKQRVLIDPEVFPAEPCEVEVDYFLDLKDKNTSTNSVGDDPHKLNAEPPSNLQQLLDLYKPKDYNITNYDQEFKWRTGSSLQNYASMFNSMFTCMRLKRQYEIKTGRLYDFCFTHRYDAINGPDIHALSNRLSTVGIPPLTIITSHTGKSDVNRWPWENWRLGPNDVFFGGDNFSMDLLMSDISRVILVNDNIYQSAGEWGGPNVIIGRSLNNSSLDCKMDANIITAIVRSQADLKRDVFESWAYHQNFWIINHSSNVTKE